MRKYGICPDFRPARQTDLCGKVEWECRKLGTKTTKATFTRGMMFWLERYEFAQLAREERKKNLANNDFNFVTFKFIHENPLFCYTYWISPYRLTTRPVIFLGLDKYQVKMRQKIPQKILHRLLLSMRAYPLKLLSNIQQLSNQ